MILFVSVLLWGLAALVVARLLRIARTEPDRYAGFGRAMLLLAVVAIPLLGRPHELLQSGQDPGVYLNSAGAFARHQSVFFYDELFAQVPFADRIAFLFGHWGYGLTKDSCLEIKEPVAIRIGPRFPPAFPILISPLIHVGDPPLALYVTPLFAFFTAVVLFMLAVRLTGRPRAGWLAALFYLATPLVIWHARAPRPELVAGFFALAGFVLALHAWEARAWARWPDLLLAAVCVATAPFFHVTAWFYAVGAAMVMLLWSASGRTDALFYPVIAAVGLVGYAAQTWLICDQYKILRFIRPCLDHPVLTGTVLLFAIFLPVVVCGEARRRQSRIPHDGAAASTINSLWVRLTAAIFVLAVCTWTYFRTQPISKRHFSGDDYHYCHPVDMRLVTTYLSGPIAALALAGLLMLILSSRPGTRARLGFLIWTLPAAFLIGNMQDFFMTRYMLPSVCPLIALGLATVVCRVPDFTRAVRPVLATSVLIVLFLLCNHRRTMITTTEYRGFTRFLSTVAEPVLAADGILLAEYPRLATPLEHIFGVPLLSLDNETRDNYAGALAAWESIMSRRPSQPAFFLTPFPPPRHDTLTFTLVQSFDFHATRLDAGRYRLPGAATTVDLNLFLYRIEQRPPPAPSLPYIVTPTHSNVGLSHFGRGRNTQAQLEGLSLSADASSLVTFDQDLTLEAGERLLVFAHTDPGSGSALGLQPMDGIAASNLILQDNWEALALTAAKRMELRTVSLVTTRNVIITDVWKLGLNDVARIVLADLQPVKRLACNTRAARCEAHALFPIPETGPAYAVMLMAAAGDSPSDGEFEVYQDAFALGRRRVAGKSWSWQIWPLNAGGTRGDWGWLEFRPPPEMLSSTSISNSPALVQIACMGVITLTNAPGAYSEF